MSKYYLLKRQQLKKSKMKIYNTNRLFFKKWLYKVETHISGASYLKRWGVEETLSFCNNSGKAGFYLKSSTADKAELKKYILAVRPFLDKQVQLRAESNTLSFFLSDDHLYKELIKSAYPWITSVTEPLSEEEAKILLEGKTSQVLCNQLPHDKFYYKLYIRYQMPAHSRLAFLEWIKNYGGAVLPSKSTVRWLSNGSPYMQDPFIHITDKNQLLLTKLYLGKYARNTQEFVLRDSGK
jgi:hypothetical protein